MIPADQFIMNPDGTAWWVVTVSQIVGILDTLHDGKRSLDRPCDECNGRGYHVEQYGSMTGEYECEACGEDARHTFTVEVENEEWHCETCNDSGISHTGDTASSCGYCPTDTITLRCSVVPGMVLPITNEQDDDQPPLDHIETWLSSVGRMGSLERYDPLTGDHYHHCDFDEYDGDESLHCFTLPPAAAPGMWAVKLQGVQV
jgi:hypothetical protein